MAYAIFLVGRIYHYRFTVDKQTKQRSTRERVKWKADNIAKRAYEEARHAAHDRALAPKLKEIAAQWVEVHRPTASAAHVKSVDTFRRLHMYDLGEQYICDITTEMVERARNEHLETHAPASANHWLAILKLLMRWAMDRKWLVSMPWKVKMIKLQKRPRATLPDTLTLTWLEALDAVTCRDPSVGTAVRLMLGIGLRELEAAGAQWEWVDWQRRTYTPGNTKGREAVALPLPDWLFGHLQQLKAKREPGASPFIALSRRGVPHGSGYANRKIRAANAVSGAGRITPHRLRGTFITMLAETAGTRMAQVLGRHKSVLTTMGYVEENMQLAQKAMEENAKKTGLTCENLANKKP